MHHLHHVVDAARDFRTLLGARERGLTAGCVVAERHDEGRIDPEASARRKWTKRAPGRPMVDPARAKFMDSIRSAGTERGQQQHEIAEAGRAITIDVCIDAAPC